MMNTQTQEALKQLIDKHKGERTFYDNEPLGVYFTMGHLENFYEEILEEAFYSREYYRLIAEREELNTKEE